MPWLIRTSDRIRCFSTCTRESGRIRGHSPRSRYGEGADQTQARVTRTISRRLHLHDCALFAEYDQTRGEDCRILDNEALIRLDNCLIKHGICRCDKEPTELGSCKDISGNILLYLASGFCFFSLERDPWKWNHFCSNN